MESLDALNALVALDREQFEALRKLAPHKGVLDHGTPRKVSRVIALHSATIATIANWLYRDEASAKRFELPIERYDPDHQLAQFKNLEV
jgi:hypothetical protein